MLLEKWIDFSKYSEILSEEMEALSSDPQRALHMLPFMGIGMLVIFVIIGIIILSTVLIQKAFSRDEK